MFSYKKWEVWAQILLFVRAALCKKALMSWVIVIPKEERACVATLALLFVWQRLFIFFWGKNFSFVCFFVVVVVFFSFFLKSRCHTKKKGGLVHALPSFWYDNDSGHQWPFPVASPVWQRLRSIGKFYWHFSISYRVPSFIQNHEMNKRIVKTLSYVVQ